MRVTLVLCAVVVAAACNGPTSQEASQERELLKRYPKPDLIPQTREPGLTISGHVDVGIVREF